MFAACPLDLEPLEADLKPRWNRGQGGQSAVISWTMRGFQGPPGDESGNGGAWFFGLRSGFSGQCLPAEAPL